MLPRTQSIAVALVAALLIILGTISMYSVEASSARYAHREAQAVDAASSLSAVELGADPATLAVPGMPY
jgi:hypothetical protein